MNDRCCKSCKFCHWQDLENIECGGKGADFFEHLIAEINIDGDWLEWFLNNCSCRFWEAKAGDQNE